jgi:hypothetical protein
LQQKPPSAVKQEESPVHCGQGIFFLKSPWNMQRFFWLLSLSVWSLLWPGSVRAQSADVEQIVTQIEEAMGGRAAYAQTRYLEWTFFGRRQLLWDKWTGNVRIEFTDKKDVLIVNVNDGSGKVWLGGVAQSNPDTLSKYLGQAKSIWINDSYWLVMPWKLRDPGLNLRLLSPDSVTGRQRLELTFQAVGDTPDNKYIILVDPETGLVDEWQFFTHYEDELPRFTTPWANYQQYGAIRLSGDRGRAQLSDIATPAEVPATAFTAYEH